MANKEQGKQGGNGCLPKWLSILAVVDRPTVEGNKPKNKAKKMYFKTGQFVIGEEFTKALKEKDDK